MTFAVGHVEGGTGAGRKVQKPARTPWECRCSQGGGTKIVDGEHVGVVFRRQQPAYMARCTDCGTRRP